MSGSNIHVSAVDLVYYAPHVIKGASSEGDVQSVIDNDTASLASSLRSFLEGGGPSNVASALQLPDRDDRSEGPASLARKRFRLHELLEDVFATQVAPFLTTPAPESPDPLDVRPLISCSVFVPWIHIDDRVPNLAQNFKPGNVIVLNSPAFGQTRHEIEDVDGERFLLRDADIISGTNRVDIVKVECTDPLRVLDVQAFHAWRDNESNNTQAGDISAFNETLYRMLYAPTDPAISSLGADELYVHYIDRPGTIGSLDDLLRAANLPDSQDRMRVESRLIIDAGASVEFGTPLNGTITGLVTAERAEDGYSESIGFDSDKVIPTVAAVRFMLAGAGANAGSERYTRYLEVDGVLHAGTECGGVYCTSRLNVDQDIRCDELTCKNDLNATGIGCSKLRAESITDVQCIETSSLTVANGMLTASACELAVKAPTFCAQTAFLRELFVAGKVQFDQDVRMSCVTADRLDVADAIVCREVESVDLTVHGSLNASGAVRAGTLDCRGRQHRRRDDSNASDN